MAAPNLETEHLDIMAEYAHAALPEDSADEFARYEFVKTFKLHVATKLAPGNKEIYERRVRPAFEREHGRTPKDRHEIRAAMSDNSYYQFWSELLRTSQEMMWDSVTTSVERQIPELIAKAKVPKASAGGSLHLDPDLETPKYHTAVDIHCMPGAYHTEVTEDDVSAGALYDRGVHVYAMGRLGPLNDDMGLSLAQHIQREYPDFAPTRILDLGCAVGNSTIPYLDTFPGAEIQAIDVGAPMLRYAHARAEALGCPIHFSQQNAESLDFEDGSFDLIVSHILIHETSAKALRKIVAECHRLLAPGGMMFHADVPQYEGMEDFDAFMLDWDTYNNNEPFWGGVHDMDLKRLAVDAGFDREGILQVLAPSAFAAEVAEAKHTNKFECGDFAGGGEWFAFGARK